MTTDLSPEGLEAMEKFLEHKHWAPQQTTLDLIHELRVTRLALESAYFMCGECPATEYCGSSDKSCHELVTNAAREELARRSDNGKS